MQLPPGKPQQVACDSVVAAGLPSMNTFAEPVMIWAISLGGAKNGSLG
jgi:hypothetical protein